MNVTTVGSEPERSRLRRSAFQTTDLDAAGDLLGGAYATTLRVRGAKHGQLIRYDRWDCGPFAVTDGATALEAGCDADPLNRLAVLQPRSGWLEHSWGGRSESSGPGDVTLVAPPDQPFSAKTHALHWEAVLLDQQLLSQTAGFADGHPSVPLRFTGTAPATPGLAAHWRDTVGYVRSVVHDTPEALSEPLLAGNVARVLAAAALATFPNTGGPEPSSADGGDATVSTVRRAAVFIEQNAHHDIGLAEIAEAARVSPGALRTAFARHHDTSVQGFLRNARLDRAHFELLDTDAGGGSDAEAVVAAIAARWGFLRPSNFAAHYHDAFGVSPFDTLTS